MRVKADSFAEACEALLGCEAAKRLVGDRYVLQGVPLCWGRQAMDSALRGIEWDATPERPKYDGSAGGIHTRSWFIRSVNAPKVQTIEHDEESPPITINKQEEGTRRPQSQAPPRMFVFSSTKKGKGKGTDARVQVPQAPPAPAERAPGSSARSNAWQQGSNLRTGWTVPCAPSDAAGDSKDADMGSEGGSGHEYISEDEFLADLAPVDAQSRVLNQLATQVANLATMMQALQVQVQEIQRGTVAPTTPPHPQPTARTPAHDAAPPYWANPNAAKATLACGDPARTRSATASSTKEGRGRGKSSSPIRERRGREELERSPRPNPGQLEF